MQPLLIFPYSGTALEALDCLGQQWQCVGFVSDDATCIGQEKFGIKIYDRSAFELFPEAKVLAVHGSPASFLKRVEILQSLALSAERFATVIHPSASISQFATIGSNVLIMAGVVITANASIGNHVIILPNAVVHHDSVIENLTLIASGVIVAGNVRVGKNCYLGAGSTIKNGVSIGAEVLVGMGANVVSSFSSSLRLKGNPARPF